MIKNVLDYRLLMIISGGKILNYRFNRREIWKNLYFFNVFRSEKKYSSPSRRHVSTTAIDPKGCFVLFICPFAFLQYDLSLHLLIFICINSYFFCDFFCTDSHDSVNIVCVSSLPGAALKLIKSVESHKNRIT